ncbi:hypothetical protein P9239_06295 [Caballeronia sp. LZ062]|uniref:hypothetical protein n=1 Tax=unclassified Caballeronia TaxID=2646786 RepID=UPI0028679865|nr:MULTISPECIES: hypothetical protein [unclassified Caballeronia]MDR5855507.1 hypothetical protein [Caballeronia sp. LZ050]MDR5869967.1 hypothetical protein [Caballeronia sp. LZ062]
MTHYEHDFLLPYDMKNLLSKQDCAALPRSHRYAVHLAQALLDHVSGTCKEVIHIESVLDMTPNYGLTTMAVLRAVLVLRSSRMIGMSMHYGKLKLIILNPALFSAATWIRDIAAQLCVA